MHTGIFLHQVTTQVNTALPLRQGPCTEVQNMAVMRIMTSHIAQSAAFWAGNSASEAPNTCLHIKLSLFSHLGALQACQREIGICSTANNFQHMSPRDARLAGTALQQHIVQHVCQDVLAMVNCGLCSAAQHLLAQAHLGCCSPGLITVTISGVVPQPRALWWVGHALC